MALENLDVRNSRTGYAVTPQWKSQFEDLSVDGKVKTDLK
jgi:hypothetical protein